MDLTDGLWRQPWDGMVLYHRVYDQNFGNILLPKSPAKKEVTSPTEKGVKSHGTGVKSPRKGIPHGDEGISTIVNPVEFRRPPRNQSGFSEVHFDGIEFKLTLHLQDFNRQDEMELEVDEHRRQIVVRMKHEGRKEAKVKVKVAESDKAKSSDKNAGGRSRSVGEKGARKHDKGKSLEEDKGEGSVSLEEGKGEGSISLKEGKGEESISLKEGKGEQSISLKEGKGEGSISLKEGKGEGSISLKEGKGEESISLKEGMGEESVSLKEGKGEGSISLKEGKGEGSISLEEKGEESISLEEGKGEESVSLKEGKGEGSISLEEGKGDEGIIQKADEGDEGIIQKTDEGDEGIIQKADEGDEGIIQKADEGDEGIIQNADEGDEGISQKADEGDEGIIQKADEGDEGISQKADKGINRKGADKGYEGIPLTIIAQGHKRIVLCKAKGDTNVTDKGNESTSQKGSVKFDGTVSSEDDDSDGEVSREFERIYPVPKNLDLATLTYRFIDQHTLWIEAYAQSVRRSPTRPIPEKVYHAPLNRGPLRLTPWGVDIQSSFQKQDEDFPLWAPLEGKTSLTASDQRQGPRTVTPEKQGAGLSAFSGRGGKPKTRAASGKLKGKDGRRSVAEKKKEESLKTTLAGNEEEVDQSVSEGKEIAKSVEAEDKECQVSLSKECQEKEIQTSVVELCAESQESLSDEGAQSLIPKHGNRGTTLKKEEQTEMLPISRRLETYVWFERMLMMQRDWVESFSEQGRESEVKILMEQFVSMLRIQEEIVSYIRDEELYEKMLKTKETGTAQEEGGSATAFQTECQAASLEREKKLHYMMHGLERSSLVQKKIKNTRFLSRLRCEEVLLKEKTKEKAKEEVRRAEAKHLL